MFEMFTSLATHVSFPKARWLNPLKRFKGGNILEKYENFSTKYEALGFLTLPEREEGQESDSNFGFQDQRKAIMWVRENIHHFGGDPERITIYGQSAGAVSTTAHMGKFLIYLKITHI